MAGRISAFRGTPRRKSSNHMIIYLDNVDSRDTAQALVGKTVVWSSPAKKQIKGKVASAHGNKGAVRVIFETGMPGQSLGTEVSVE